MQNFDHNIGFWEKRNFFRQKLSKIAENCDHNIDPLGPMLWFGNILAKNLQCLTEITDISPEKYLKHLVCGKTVFLQKIAQNSGHKH
jgi:hypothetical protein